MQHSQNDYSSRIKGQLLKSTVFGKGSASFIRGCCCVDILQSSKDRDTVLHHLPRRTGEKQEEFVGPKINATERNVLEECNLRS